MPAKCLHIPGYSIELEINSTKQRVATYISNRLKYRRRQDLEEPNYHMIILDIGTQSKYAKICSCNYIKKI